MDPDIDLFSNIDSDAKETILVMIPPGISRTMGCETT